MDAAYLSMRRAYSSIFIRRIMSSFTFSNERRSPSNKAIRACDEIYDSVGSTRHGWYEPSFQLAQSPIHFCRARIVSILSAGNVGQLRGLGPVRLEVVVGEGFDSGPEAAAAADPD